MSLTDAQARAARRTGQDVCVVAGPGSGKTRVLVERFCWLVERGVHPQRILAITFTEKAATEIKKRVVEAFVSRPEIRTRIERAYVSTIHGFCARLLRENSIAAALDPEFSVMDEAESLAEIEEAAHGALDCLYQERPSEFRALLNAIYTSTDLGGSLLGVYEAMRIAGLTPEDLRARAVSPDTAALFRRFLTEVRAQLGRFPPPGSAKQRSRFDALRDWLARASDLPESPVSSAHFQALADFPTGLAGLRPGHPVRDWLKPLREQRLPELQAALVGECCAPHRALLVDALDSIDRAYRRRKQELAALDYSDLEERAIDLLRGNPAVRARLRSSFDQILMDELQDTNRLQWTLLELLRTPEHFFAVGDINQSIYGFRHAEPAVFREYRDAIAAQGREIDELVENHRSREDILAAVSRIFGGAEGIEARELRAARRFPEKREPSVEVVIGNGDTSARATEVEALWVARRIRELVGALSVSGRPARFRDIAVLVRTVNAMPPLEEAFREFRVPCLTSGGKTFYETREVKDLVHWLRVVANARDEVALAGLLRSPFVGVRDETVLRLKQLAKNLGTALFRLDGADTSLFDADDLERLRQFRDQLRRMRALGDDLPPDRLLSRVIDESDYEASLDSRARSNIDKFLALLRSWTSRRTASIGALVAEMEWRRAAESETGAPPDDSSDVVRLMTIHQAKGLQFPVVILPALHKGVDRRKPPVCLSSEGRLGALWRTPSDGDSAPDLAHLLHGRELERKEQSEENRLLYVAMTRAEEHLVLSFARTRGPTSRWWERVASRLEIDWHAIDDRPVAHTPAAASFSVRLLRTAAAPEPVPEPASPVPAGKPDLLLSRPELTGQHDSVAPVTSVAMFDACPRRYYLGRYIGWAGRRQGSAALEYDDAARDDDTPDAAEFGLQVHALLAGGPADGAGAEALELADRFRRSPLGQRAARAIRIGRESDFLMAVEEVVLRGQIDLWFEEGGEVVLVDYKTDDVSAQDAHAHVQAYALQLRLYALALERIAGRLPGLAVIHLLRPDVAVQVALDPPLLEAARDSVRAFRDAQSGLNFPLREGEQCLRCPFYRGLCPAGTE